MTKLKSFLLLALVAGLFTSCRNDGKGQQDPDVQGEMADQDVRLAPGDYVVDEPGKLMEYFDALCHNHCAMVAVHVNDNNDSLKVWQAIKSLDEFKSGERAFYPAEEVRHALGVMAFELGYCFNHAGFEDTNRAELFFFRFLEQAVRLSPQVDFVTDFHCADGTAGILNYHEWSPSPMYSFLVYPTENGLRVRMVGKVGEFRINKLFHLTDDAGCDYYLCSNEGDHDDAGVFYGTTFCQYLYMRDGENMKEIASYVGHDFVSDEFEGKFVFNPRLLRWDCCKKVGDKYVRVEGTRSLQLALDGEKSFFSVVAQ